MSGVARTLQGNRESDKLKFTNIPQPLATIGQCELDPRSKELSQVIINICKHSEDKAELMGDR